MNTLRQIKVILYRLKRNFGIPVKIIHTVSQTYDVQTGETVRSEDLITVRRGICITPRVARDFSYDLSFIAANKNFTYGGFYDTASRVLILDSKDVPRTYVPDLNHRCTIEGERYEFEKIDSVTQGLGYMIGLRNVTSQPIEDIHETQSAGSMTMSQETA